jgi:hypothetical protein
MPPDLTLVEFEPNAHNHTPPQSVGAGELMTYRLPPREMLVGPIIRAKGLAMLYGPRGLGKTHVALGIAWAAAGCGSRWPTPS